MMTSPIYLHAAAIVASLICSFFYIHTALTFWKPKRHRPYLVAFLMGILNWGVLFFDNAILAFMVYFFAEAILLRFALHTTNTQAIFAATSSTLCTMCIKGIVVGITALGLGKNLYQIITVPDWSLMTFTAIMLIKPIFFRFFHIPSLRSKIIVLLRTPKELDAVLMQHGALFVFMLYYSYNYYYNLDLIWFTFAQIILSLLLLFLYGLILLYGTRVSNLLEGEVMNERIQLQMNSQLTQYESYQSTLSQVDDFKHHFKEYISGMDKLLGQSDSADAKQRLQQAYPILLEKLPTKTNYANNELLNATLYNWDQRVQKYNIQFECSVYLPPAFEPKARGLLSIFAVLEDIFLPLAQPAKKPQIKIVGEEIQKNFTISISGSILGYIEERYDLPYFVTPNGEKIKPLYHKLTSIADSMNATLFWNYTKETNMFQIVMSVHA